MKILSEISDKRENSKRWHQGLMWAERTHQQGKESDVVDLVETFIKDESDRLRFFAVGARDYLNHLNNYPFLRHDVNV